MAQCGAEGRDRLAAVGHGSVGDPRRLLAILLSPCRQYLDFANPNGLGGDQYRWVDANQDGQFYYDEATTLLRRFGGAVSEIDPNLKASAR